MKRGRDLDKGAFKLILHAQMFDVHKRTCNQLPCGSFQIVYRSTELAFPNPTCSKASGTSLGLIVGALIITYYTILGRSLLGLYPPQPYSICSGPH